MERDSDGFIFRDGLSDFDKAYFRGQVVEDDDFVVGIDYNVPSRDPNSGVCGSGARCVSCHVLSCIYNHSHSHYASDDDYVSRGSSYSPEFGSDESFLEVGW